VGKNGPPRQAEPEADSLSPVPRQQRCKRNGNPETEAVEAIEPATDYAFAGQTSQAEENIPRSILGLKQVRRAPHCESGDEKPQACGVVHQGSRFGIAVLRTPWDRLSDVALTRAQGQSSPHTLKPINDGDRETEHGAFIGVMWGPPGHSALECIRVTQSERRGIPHASTALVLAGAGAGAGAGALARAGIDAVFTRRPMVRISVRF